MNTTTVYFLFSIGLAVALVLSNPKEQAHREAVKTKVNSVFRENMGNTDTIGDFEKFGKGLGFLFGGLVVEKLVDNYITCDNYVLFSLTKSTINNKTRTIGFGVLGNVFISSEIKTMLNDRSGGDEGGLPRKVMSEVEIAIADEPFTESKSSYEETEIPKNEIDGLDIQVRNKFKEWEKYLIDNSIFDCVTNEACENFNEMMKLSENGKYPMRIYNPTYIFFDANGDGVEDYIISYGMENCVRGSGWTRDFVILISDGKSAVYKVDKDLATDLKTKFLDYAINTVGEDAYVYIENSYVQAKGLSIEEIQNNHIIYGKLSLQGNGANCCPEINGVFYYDLISKEFHVKLKS
jgi:hypothetical protein